LYAKVSKPTELLICWKIIEMKYYFEFITKDDFNRSENIRRSSSQNSSSLKYFDSSMETTTEQIGILETNISSPPITFNSEEQNSLVEITNGEALTIVESLSSVADISIEAHILRENNSRKNINRFINHYWPRSTFFAEARVSAFKQFGTPYYFVKQDKIYAEKLATLGTERSKQMVIIKVGGVNKRVKYFRNIYLLFFNVNL